MNHKYIKSTSSELFFYKVPRNILLVLYKEKLPENRNYRSNKRTYYGDFYNITQISRMADVTRSAAVKIIYEFEELGLVRIERVARFSSVKLTDQGIKAAENIIKIDKLLGAK